MLKINALSFKYSTNHILSFPDWELQKKDQALILGSSGSGKTTMLHLIGGLLKPTTGSIEVEGTDLSLLSGGQLDNFRGRHIGFVFQKPHLLPSLTVQENIGLATFLSKKKSSARQLQQVMEQLEISSLAHRKVHQISQGQAQRVAIARAVINEPDLILGDEPTSSLDDDSCEAVIRLLQSQAENCSATLIIATHDQRVKSRFPNCLSL